RRDRALRSTNLTGDARPVRTRMAISPSSPPPARGALDDPPPAATAPRGEAPGDGLHVDVLLVPPLPAGALAARCGRGPGRWAGVPRPPRVHADGRRRRPGSGGFDPETPRHRRLHPRSAAGDRVPQTPPQ